MARPVRVLAASAAEEIPCESPPRREITRWSRRGRGPRALSDETVAAYSPRTVRRRPWRVVEVLTRAVAVDSSVILVPGIVRSRIPVQMSRRSVVTDMRIVEGDLEMLAASMDEALS